MADDQQIDIDKVLKERFLALPKVVQDSIISTDISERLRALASTHKLHVDQWQRLENEVMLTILGIQAVETFSEDIREGVGITAEDAAKLATDINAEIFEPIRKELERELDHPAAEAKVVSDIEASRTQILGSKPTEPASSLQLLASSEPKKPTVPSTPIAPAVLPATPPAPAPDTKAVRAPMSASYTAGQASHERKMVEGDPYREQLL
ncbi:hypothetical protein HY968_03875 [Candidatus Kaiserbacteria bacterium]|nr:hypothetical protein [Candidatus Kaiserbacteria bacterium]